MNDAPVAVNDTDAVNEDATVTRSSGSNLLMADDSDADDDDSFTVTQIAVTGGDNSAVTSGSSYNSNGRSVTGTYGTLTVGADGTYTYVADQSASDDLDASDTATDSFTYTISDGDATDTATLIFTVTGINDAPVAVNDTDAVNEDATVTRSSGSNLLMADDSDADDDDTFTVTQIAVTGSSNSAVSSGSSYNSSGTSVTGTYGTLTVGADGTYTYVADQSASDDLDLNDTATDSFTYTISDGDATDTATLIFTVTGINDAPVAVNDTDSVNEDATVTRTSGSNLLMADDSDADDDDTFTVTQIAVTGSSNSAVSSGTNQSNGTSVTGTYGTLTVGADGTYTYVADQSGADDLDASDTATDSFTYTISDGDATDTATLIFTVTGVNDIPTASDNTVSTSENTAYVFSTSDFGYTDADDDDSLVSVKITTLEDAGALQYYNGSAWVDVTLNQVITATDISANKLRLNPASNENGSPYTTFNFTVNDGDADSATPNTITINVTNVNNAPVADNETNSVNEDATVTVTDGTSDVLHGDTDADSDTLTVTQIAVTGGSNSSVSSGSSYNSNGTSVTGTYGTLTIGADGTYTYIADQSASDDLDASDTATDSFTYTVSDGNGGTDTATLIFTVTGINDAPVAVNDTDNVNEDATVTQTSGSSLLMADDSDADDDDSFTVTQIAVTGGSNSAVSSGTNQSNGTSVTGTYGTLTVGADGTYTYVADQSDSDDLDASDTATDSFTYTISDGDATDTATLIFTVTGVNDAPVAVNDTDAVNEDATVTRSSGSNLLMADDTDADDDDSFTVTQIAVTGSSNSAVSSGSSYNSSGTSVTGTYGTLTVGADGTYTYVADQSAADDLDASDTATDSFTYTISDGDATDTATLIFTVTGVNDAPVAVNDTDAVNEDATVTRTSGSNLLMADDSDADDDDSFTVTQIAVTGGDNSAVASSSSYNSNGTSVTGTYGTLTVGADGTYTYVADQSASDDLDASDTATDSFTYTISDGDATDTATLIFTVTGINDDPVAVNDTDAVNEDATVTRSSGSNLLMADDTDADDDDSFTVTQIAVTGGSNSSVASSSSYNSNGTSVTGTYGTLTVGADGTYTYVADQSASDDLDLNDTATDSFTYTISDGDATDTATLIFTVTGINDAPVAVNDTDSVNEDATVTRSSGSNLLMADDSDADDDDSFTVTQIAVTGGDNSAVSSGSSYNSSGTSVTGTYGTLTVGADGTYTYVADQSASDDLDASDTATDSFTYTVSDGTATDTATLIFTVTGVNDTPTASDKTVSTAEDTPYVFSTSDFGYTDADDDDTLVSITITTLEDAGALQYYNGSAWVDVTLNQVITATDISNNYLRLNPASNENGSPYTTFNFTVNDGDASSSTPNTITVNVTAVNDSPVADNETNSVNEDATVTVTDGTSDVLHGDTDVDTSDTLTVTQISVTGGSNSAVSSGTNQSNGTSVTGTYGTLTIGADGTYTYTADQSTADDLDASDTATDSFTYTVSDGTATDTATLIITVTGVNDAPVAVNDTDAVNEDATVTQSSGSSLLMADDSDADDDDSFTVTQIAVTGGDNSAVSSGSSYNSSGTSVTGTYGTLTVGADGTYTYVADQSASDDLDASDTATDSFTYTISDGDATDTATLIFTVTGINDAPVAVNDTDAVNEDATVTRSSGATLLMADDSDADDDDSFTVTQIAVTGGSNSSVASGSSYNSSGTSVTGTYGTLTVGADGTYTYVADQSAADDLDASDTATDSFTYTISDGDATDTATLIFTVTGVNDAPTASNNSITTNEDTNHVFSASEFNFSDADDSGSLNKIKITSLEDNGALQYYNGSAWVDVTLNQEITAADISNNYLRFKPDANENGSSYTSFDFQVSDGTVYSSSSSTMTVNVTAVNDAPTATNDTASVNEDATTTISSASNGVIDDNDTDPDSSDTLTITNIAHTNGNSDSVTSSTTYLNGQSITGTYGTLTIGANGTYTYVADQSSADDLDASDTANDVFTYTLSDGTTTDTATITFTVTGVNDAPVAVNDTDAVNEDATVTRSSGSNLLMADDSDADDDDSFTVTQIAVTGGDNSAVSSGSSYNSSGTSVTGTYGALTVGADGTYTYVANQSAADDLDAGDTATDSFTYTISDGDATDTATLIFTVTGVNDAPVAVNDTDALNEDATVTRSSGANLLMADDTDADDDDTSSITQISVTGGSNSSVASSSSYNSNGTSVTGTYGTLTVGADGTYTYVADQSASDNLDLNDTATDSFTYTISDGDATDTATLIFTVTGLNDTPVANADTGSVNEDSTLTVSNAGSGVIQNNDTDADDSSSLSVTFIGTGSNSDQAVQSGSTYNSGTPTTVTGTYGQLTIGADGTYTYVANQSAADDLDAGDTATDTFTYTLSDGTSTDTTTISFTVTGINDAPTASDNTVSTDEDTPYVFSTSDFGYTDTDDDDALVSVKITTLEDAGALQYYNGSAWVDVTLNQVITATDISNNYLRLNPTANETGSPYTTIGFSVNDGDADSSSSYTMTVNVTNTNDAPTGVADTDSVNEDATVTKTGAQDDVINDDTDNDNDTLTVTFIGTGSSSDETVASSSTYNSNGTTVTGTYGQLTIGADGSYTYVANQSAADDLDANDTATDTFTYTVSDGNGGTDTATLSFTVTGVNDAPTASNNTVSTAEDTPYVFSTSDFGYTDADDDDVLVSVTITTLEDAGALQYYDGSNWQNVTLNQEITASDITSGYLRLNPTANENGSPYTTFEFSVNDGDADSSSSYTMTINVTATNDNPVADNETNTATEGSVTRVTDGNFKSSCW